MHLICFAFALALALPLAVDAQIGIAITAAKDGGSSSGNTVTTWGTEQHVITDDEKSCFGITFEKMLEGIEKVLGKKPDHAFLRSPTYGVGATNNDMFAHYMKTQTQLLTRPIKSEILEVSTKPTIVYYQVFENLLSKREGTYGGRITHTVTNTVQKGWNTERKLGVTHTINVKFAVADTSTAFSFENKWGRTGATTNTTTLAAGSDVKVTLGPGEKVRASLISTSGSLSCRVFFLSEIIGEMAINFVKPFDGHHHYFLLSKYVLQDVGVETEKVSDVVYDVAFFAGATVQLSEIY